MNDFEVGDRVRETLSGKKGEIVGFDSVLGDCSISLDSGTTVFRNKLDVKLISKGEDSMQDVDAIAVEVDDKNLWDAILNKAGDEGYKWDSQYHECKERQTIVFTKHNKSITTSPSDAEHMDYTEIGLSLPQDWNKVVEFLEQDQQPTPTLNGYEANIKSDGNGHHYVEVGCWKDRWYKLKKWKEKAEEIGIEEGTVTVKGEEIDIQELYDFIEDVKDVVES